VKPVLTLIVKVKMDHESSWSTAFSGGGAEKLASGKVSGAAGKVYTLKDGHDTGRYKEKGRVTRPAF